MSAQTIDTTGLADRIWLAAKAGQPCYVTPDEMNWLRCEFALGDPLGEAEFNSWLLRSSEAFRTFVPATPRESVPTHVPSVSLIVRRPDPQRVG